MPRKRKPPSIGKATPGAYRRFAELFDKHGKQNKNIASRRALLEFEKEYKKVKGRWVPKKAKNTAVKTKSKKRKNTSSKKKVAKKLVKKVASTKDLEKRYGIKIKSSQKIKFDIPKELLGIGKLHHLGYIKDGEPYTIYTHEFKKMPKLTYTKTGKRLITQGGNIGFGKTGITG